MIILLIIDGVLADYLKNKNLKNFQFLFKNAAYSLNMKLSYPSITEPSMSAILHGVDATFLETYYDNIRYYGRYQDYPKDATSIFKAIKPNTSAIVGTWKGFTEQLLDPKYVNKDFSYRTRNLDHEVIENAVKIIKGKLFDFLLVYLESPDHVGHDHGVGEEYVKSLQVADTGLGQLLDIMDKKDTLFVVSDHGRNVHSQNRGRSHHVYSSDALKVPFFAYGNKIKKGEIHSNFLHTTDISPTILHLFGKKPHPSMRGLVMKSIIK
jgi:predicted AlkP superfamily pyrophosphatase or phosphodiesterase